MTTSEVQGYLSESRGNLARAWGNLGGLRYSAPGIYSSVLGEFMELGGRQLMLEKSLNYANGRGNSLGNPLLFGVGAIALTALTGFGAWIFSQFQSTSRLDKYLECVNNLIKQGTNEKDAAKICAGKTPLISFDFGGIGGILGIGALAFLIFWLLKKK